VRRQLLLRHRARDVRPLRSALQQQPMHSLLGQKRIARQLDQLRDLPRGLPLGGELENLLLGGLRKRRNRTAPQLLLHGRLLRTLSRVVVHLWKCRVASPGPESFVAHRLRACPVYVRRRGTMASAMILHQRFRSAYRCASSRAARPCGSQRRGYQGFWSVAAESGRLRELFGDCVVVRN